MNRGETFGGRWDELELILEHIQEGVYITDNEANTVYINHTYERISGLLKTEMLGKNMRDLVERGVISASGTLTVLETGESVTMEQRFRTGKRAIITSSPIFRDTAEQAHIMMVVTIVREITELYSIKKELSKAERRNRQYAFEIERLRNEVVANAEMVAVDEASVKLLHLAERVSLLDSPVLISGEPGVGKEKTARFIHDHSGRSKFQFMRINASVIPRNDAVGYLFGYEDPDTGEYHMGMLEGADGGTVYIDEIAGIPPAVRERFLMLLRDGSCVMGDGIVHRMNIRLIVGSRYTFAELKEGQIVEKEILDHFSLLPIHIPPLRERREDIVPLLEYFLRRYQRKTGEKKYFSRDCYKKLLAYQWPGNVREVNLLVQRTAVVSRGEEILPADIFSTDGDEELAEADAVRLSDAIEAGGELDLKGEVAKLEAYYMSRAFEKYRNIRIAADKLGMDSSTFVRKRQRYEKMGLMDRERKK